VTPRRDVAVVGGGWAGLTAAVEAARAGHRVTLFEMAPQLGGRAREVPVDGLALDNGQHIAIGAYASTLRLLHVLGISEDMVFVRTPLVLQDARGVGLALGGGPPTLAFALGVLRHPAWKLREKVALLRTASGWRRAGFRCDPALTVEQLSAGLPAAIRHELVEPLCVAALNTPAPDASAAVFLRVLGDALFGGRGAADLLLPKVSLGAIVPEPAAAWLARAGSRVILRRRVETLEADGSGWRVDGERHDAVVLAASPGESARLAAPHAEAWAACAASLPYEPTVTVYLRSTGASLPGPMLALASTPKAPAQFVFDRGRLGGPSGLLAFVVSGAAPWVEAGTPATLAATRAQASAALGPWLGGPLETVQVVVERRATIRCTPGLVRPPLHVAPGLAAAGDHVDGPYPSTLEGAVRSGVAAVQALGLSENDPKASA
jgi:squalene-associated FAD-dependent desaturase